MIDFRYHVVSLTAVLLALAAGLVLGSVVLDEPLVRAAADRADALGAEQGELRQEMDSMAAELEAERAFSREVAPSLVSSRLDGEVVLLVQVPGVEDWQHRDAADAVEQAGGTVSGTVTLRPAYADPEQAPVVDELVSRLVPAGVDLPSGSASDRAATELAAVLMTTGARDEPSRDAEARSSVLTGFRELDLVRTSGGLTQASTLALVLTGAPEQRTGAEGQGATSDEAVLRLLRELRSRSRGTVVAGPAGSASPGGLVAQVRDSADASAAISTVDALGTTAGRVAAAVALAEQAGDGVGHYGTEPGATRLIPDGVGKVGGR